MSPKRLLVRGSAAAVALSLSPPLAAAVGSISPDNSICDYPPWNKSSFFDTWWNKTLCLYSTRYIYSITGELPMAINHLEIVVEDAKAHTGSINFPKSHNRPAFRAQYSYYTAHLTRFIQGPHSLNSSIYNFDYDDTTHPLPNNTGINPLRTIDTSSLREVTDRLDLAASRVQFEPDDYDYYEEEDHDEGSGPFRHQFDAIEKNVPVIASTELPIEELEEVCSAAMKLVKENFGGFDSLCGVLYEASQAALSAARRAGWQFIENTVGSRVYTVIPIEHVSV
ncbi:hypothetical protein FOL46_007982 [Perkinsus olseni]|uniref:Uncharacterized protein n=1 Tax=Perkinsus olseni TaxID=32597 RepID=A0A7J6MN91_PEROL|nr:hypothetical protein FOL46_007982 [Perkinsus olseni]